MTTRRCLLVSEVLNNWLNRRLVKLKTLVHCDHVTVSLALFANTMRQHKYTETADGNTSMIQEVTNGYNMK